MIQTNISRGFLQCFLGLLVVGTLNGAVITRGPYLQNATHNSMVIRWRTDVATDSIVRYGLVVGSLGFTTSDSASVVEHEVRLTGLTPNTKYFYSVGSSSQTLAGNDAEHFFLTNPTPGTAKNTRIWVVGDAGTSGAPGSDQARVRDAYATWTGARHTDLWLQLGDNAYNDGTDAQFQTKCFGAFSNMFRKSCCWSTIGNHELGLVTDKLNPPADLPYYANFTFPKNGEAGGVPSGTEDYYAVDYGNIHLICLDSHTEVNTVGSPMWTWLSNDLASTSAKWIIAYWHWPPHSRGSNGGNGGMRANICPLLEKGGVDLVLCGHSHGYERSFFMDGFYGAYNEFNAGVHLKQAGSGREDGTGSYIKSAGANKGAVYTVAGSSGQVTAGSMDHSAMYLSLLRLGSFVLDINGNRLDATFLSDTGSILDYFTIIKSTGAPMLTSIDVTPSPVMLAPGGVQQFTAVARDQNGVPMVPQPSITWSFSGSAAQGALNSTGLFTAGSVEGGPYTITASASGLSGTASVTVASSTTVSFQDGVGGYNGTVDTYISEQAQTTAFPTDARLNVNYYVSTTAPENTQVLMKFDLSTIPAAATVTSASMTLYCTRTNQIDVADVMMMNRVTSAWAETHTWSAGVPSHVASGVTLPSLAAVGPTNAYVINGMSSLVQDWVNNPSANQGVIFVGSGRMNYRFASREISSVSLRPKLTVSYTLSSGGDSDSDGLPDSWENSHFGSLAQDGAGDFDGDGVKNSDEFNAGSAPNDRASRLMITQERFINATDYSITWQSTNGKSYKVETSVDMTTWSETATVPSGGLTTSWTDTSTVVGRKFYRVKTP